MSLEKGGPVRKVKEGTVVLVSRLGGAHPVPAVDEKTELSLIPLYPDRRTIWLRIPTIG